MTARPRWVVFDHGGVISEPTAALPALASMLGVPEREFTAAYAAERARYDRGECTDLDYWCSVGGRLGVEVDEEFSRKLTERDIDGWMVVATGVLPLIDDLYRDGVALALLSNAPSSFAAAMRGQRRLAPFRHLLFSGDLRCAKPDPEIWRILLVTLGAGPRACVFFDDRQDNVDAALRAGLRAQRWHDAEHARGVLRRQGLLVT